MRMRTAVALLVLGLLAPLTSRAAEPLLARVPADAWAVAVVPGLERLDAKLDRLQQQLGVPIPKTFPLLSQAAGIAQGLDKKGTALALVLPGSDENSPPAMIALLPTTDYQQVAKSLHASDPAAPVSEVKIAQHPFLLGKLDGYAVLSDPRNRAAMETVLHPTANLSSDLKPYAAWLSENDLTVIATRHGIETLVARGRKGIEQIETAIDSFSLPKEQKEQMRAGFQIHRQLLAALDQEVAAFGLGVRVNDDDSLAVVGRTRLMPQGQLAKMVAPQEAPKERLLAELPSLPFVLAAEGTMNEKAMDALMNFASHLPQYSQYGLTPEQTSKIFEISREQMKKIQRMAMLLAVGEKDDPIYSGTVALMKVDDAPQFLRDYPELLKRMKAILGDAKDSPFGELESSQLEIEKHPAIKVVMGRPKMPSGPALPVAEKIFDAMFGPGQPITFYMAVADQHTLVAGYINPDLIATTIQSLKGSEHLASRKEVETTTALLPKEATCVGYWSIPGTLQLASRVLAMVVPGQPSTFRLPEFPATPPVGLALVPGEQEIRGEVVLPKETVHGIGVYIAKFRTPPQQAEKSE